MIVTKIALIVAAVAGTAVYYLQAMQKSLCRYAGDGSDEFMVLRDRCYANSPEWKMILFSFLVGLGIFLFFWASAYFIVRIQKYFHHMKNKK